MTRTNTQLTASVGFRTLIKKLRLGYKNYKGKRIEGNDRHDYEAFVKHLKRQGLRHRSIRRELLYLHKFDVDVEPVTLSNFTKHIVVTQKKKTSTEETVKRRNYAVYIALKNYLQAISKKELLQHLPDARAVPKPHSSARDKSITQKDFDRLLGAVDDEEFALFLRVLWDSGLRATEALLLRANWIDLSKKPVEITIPLTVSKAREEQTTYITDGTSKELKAWLTNKFNVSDLSRCTKFVFCFLKESAKQPSTKTLDDLVREFWLVRKKLNYYQEKAGLRRHISVHCLRHSFAHRLENDDFTPSEIQRLMRHSSLLTTDRYLHTSQKQVAKKFQSKYNVL